MAIGQTLPYSISMIILMSILLFNRANSKHVGWLVITSCPVGCPNTPLADWLAVQHALAAVVSSPTTLLAIWSSLCLPPLAAPSAPPPHHQQTGHPSNIPCWQPHQPHHPTVGQQVTPPTYPDSCPIIPSTRLSANWSPLQHTLSAAPSDLPPHCRPTGHHSNISCWLPHQPHHPTVSWLVTTSTSPAGQLVTLTGHHLHLPCQPPH